MEQFLLTFWLLQNILVSPSIRTPNILNFYYNSSISSISFFNAIISLPKVLDSTEFCRLLFQMTGALLQNNKKPVWLLLYIRFPVKSASTKQFVDIGFPSFSGQSVGVSYFSPRYKLYHLYLFNILLSASVCAASNAIFLFGWVFKYLNIWISCLKCPNQGSAKCDDISEVSSKIFTLPNSTIQRSTPIISW